LSDDTAEIKCVKIISVCNDFKKLFQRKKCEKEYRTIARSIYVISIPVNQSIMDDVYT
jgi:hypothetical protein